MSSVLMRGVLIWYLLSLSLLAESQAGAPTKVPPDRPHAQKAPSLTPRQQQGLKMLQAAEAEAKSLPAPMRAYLLLELAPAYADTNPGKERTLRLQAFESTLYIEDDSDNKDFIQDQVLKELLSSSQPDLEAVLPNAIPHLRNQYTGELSREYARSNQFDRVLELIHRVASESEFPYGAAATLMIHLPEDSINRRQELFNEALSSYESETGEEHFRREDMATLVIRFWDKLPPSLILEATDQVLDRAKRQSDSESARVFNVLSRKGAVSLDSLYRYRLFQLLPVLQRLVNLKANNCFRKIPASRDRSTNIPMECVHSILL